MAQYDTIVVGLGSSGTTAATTLARAGRRVLGLEAQDRIGGRVRTVPFGDGVVELGAEWIHGQHSSRVYDLAISNKVPVIPQDMTIEVFRSDGSIADQTLLNELILVGMSAAENPPPHPEPLGQYITKNLTGYIKEKYPQLIEDEDFIRGFLDFMNLLINNYEASDDWNDVSAYTRYEELEGHQHISWHANGYKTFFDILLNTYNNGPGLSNLEIKLSTEVTRIEWPQGPSGVVRVTTKDGSTYTADNVIVTISIGVLKERYETLFASPLPVDKVTAIKSISIGVMDKVILLFPEIWWPQNVTWFGFLWRDSERKKIPAQDYWVTRIFGASTPMGSKRALTLWTSGRIAQQVETLPEDVLKTKCLELLRRFMGTNTTIPEPTQIIRSTWYSNPYTRGSYTYDNNLVTVHPDARASLARPLVDSAGTPRVLFAGEATDQTHFSTVHGAADTGYREAARLLPQSKI